MGMGTASVQLQGKLFHSLDDINKDLGKGSLGREPLEIKLSWEEVKLSWQVSKSAANEVAHSGQRALPYPLSPNIECPSELPYRQLALCPGLEQHRVLTSTNLGFTLFARHCLRKTEGTAGLRPLG